MVNAVAEADVVISGLGLTKKQDPAILSDGARLVASASPRVVWLTSLGMGATEGALGSLNGALLRRILRHEWDAPSPCSTAGETLVVARPSSVL
ncbi:hypothetical protein ACWGII_32745 [Streptomyces sp. NPDC054855]